MPPNMKDGKPEPPLRRMPPKRVGSGGLEDIFKGISASGRNLLGIQSSHQKRRGVTRSKSSSGDTSHLLITPTGEKKKSAGAGLLNRNDIIQGLDELISPNSNRALRRSKSADDAGLLSESFSNDSAGSLKSSEKRGRRSDAAEKKKEKKDRTRSTSSKKKRTRSTSVKKKKNKRMGLSLSNLNNLEDYDTSVSTSKKSSDETRSLMTEMPSHKSSKPKSTKKVLDDDAFSPDNSNSSIKKKKKKKSSSKDADGYSDVEYDSDNNGDSRSVQTESPTTKKRSSSKSKKRSSSLSKRAARSAKGNALNLDQLLEKKKEKDAKADEDVDSSSKGSSRRTRRPPARTRSDDALVPDINEMKALNSVNSPVKTKDPLMDESTSSAGRPPQHKSPRQGQLRGIGETRGGTRSLRSSSMSRSRSSRGTPQRSRSSDSDIEMMALAASVHRGDGAASRLVRRTKSSESDIKNMAAAVKQSPTFEETKQRLLDDSQHEEWTTDLSGSSRHLNHDDVSVSSRRSHRSRSSSHSDSMRFEDAWNDDDDGPPSEDVGNILLAVLKSKLLDPRSKQDRIKEEIKKLRACLRKAIALLPSDDGIQPNNSILSKKLKEQAEIIQEYRIQIDSLESDLQNEKDVKAVLQSHVDSSKEHEEALKAEIHDFESLVEVLKADIEDLESQVVTGLDNGGGEGGSTSFKELREAKARITELEDELKEATTVTQMQITELDEERNMLEGKLKAERLDSTAKLASKDETIQQLRKRLETYEKHADDAQDLTAARQKLQEARDDAAAVRKSLDVINQEMDLIHKDQDKLVESNTALKEQNQRLEQINKELNQKTDSMNAKVLEWMDQAYAWKEKAEIAERKVAASQHGDVNSSEFRVDQVEAALEVQSQNPQGLFLQAVMEKSKAKEQQAAGNKWNTFFRKAIVGTATDGGDGVGGGGNGELLSAEEQRIKILEEQKSQLELAVAELRRENVMLKASQKGQIYEFQNKIEELNAEVQNKVQRRRSQASMDEEEMFLEIGDAVIVENEQAEA